MAGGALTQRGLAGADRWLAGMRGRRRWLSAHTGLTVLVGCRTAFLRRYFGTCSLQSGFVKQSFVVPAAFDTRNRPAFPARRQKSGRLGHLPAPAWRYFARR